MSDALSITAKASLQGTFTQTLTGANGSAALSINEALSLFFADGVSTAQADKLWLSKDRALTSGNSEDIDLYDFGSIDIGAGAGKDPFGQALALVEIAFLLVYNQSGSAGTLDVGAKNTAAAFNSLFIDASAAGVDNAAFPLPPGALAMFACPHATAWQVADTSNHLLKIAARGGNCTYNIIVGGRSA